MDNTAGTPVDIDFIVDRILLFTDFLAGDDNKLRPYQLPFARRYIESVVIEDSADLTALYARQSGKSETVCNVTAALMVLLPRLAKIFPDLLGKFKQGVMVGIFAPTDEQADTIFSRLVDRLTSEHAQEILRDPEIDDIADGKSTIVRLKRCGSFARKMTANPKAKIESKTYHIAILDECQDIDEYVIRKSIMPMLASTAGTTIRTGTPNQFKGDFYKQIQQNKRNYLNKRGAKQDHFEADWKEVSKYSPQYRKHIAKQMEHPGEDSSEFQMSYALKWMLDRGMFTTDTRFDELGDVSAQEMVKTWTRTPVVVGIDPARTTDSTVVTVVWVDWDRPDQFGYYDHRILNWLELQSMAFEQQYFEIVRFLDPYSIYAVGVDSQGMGMAVAERLGILLRHKNAEIIPMQSHAGEQNKRWKHLTTLMDRGMISWPAGAKVRRLRTWKRFQEQMVSAEKHFQGPNIVIKAPDEAGAHDDYVDSLALACYCSTQVGGGEVEQITAPWFR